MPSLPLQDIPLNMEKIEANRNFANKLWNCCKFVTGNALKDISPEEEAELAVKGPITKVEFDTLPLPEKYIISKCHTLVASVTEQIESYNLGAAGSLVYAFLWDLYADWYIEISKTRLYEGLGGDNAEQAKMARRVLVYILDTSLRLLHPYMPFVTEQLWHHLPRAEAGLDQKAHALMLSDWPQLDDAEPLVTSPEAVSTFECFQALTRSIRNARAEYNVEPGKRISAVVVADTVIREEVEKEVNSLVALAKLEPGGVQFFAPGSEGAKAAAADSVRLVIQDGVEAFLPLSGLIDVEKERMRLEKQNEKLAKEIEKLEGRLNSPGFVDKAPEAVVEKAKKELAELQDQASKVKASLESL
jgi:valyl-tRNA synthetase